MTLYQRLSGAFAETIVSPQDGVRKVLDWPIERTTLWLTAVVVAIAAVILNGVLVLARPELLQGPQMIPTSPFLQALVVWGGLVLTVYGTHYIGKMFGGAGEFDDSLAAIIWLQVVMLVFQVGQLIVLFVSDSVAGLASIALFFYTIWLFINFVAAVHKFKSVVMVLIGFIAASIGIGIGLLVLFSVIAVVTGLDIQNV